MPDLVVCGSRGHGPLASVVMGSVSAEVVDHAPCPVLVARHSSVHRLVVGVDGSAPATHAIATLKRWPIFRHLATHLVTVAQPISNLAETMGSSYYPAWVDMHDERKDRRQQLRDIVDRTHDELAEGGISASTEMREGDPADQLIRAASESEADLIVVGSRGLSTLPRLVLGSVARKVLLHAPQSVLVVREVVERVRSPEAVQAATSVPSAVI